jgi:hypothetical protein
MSDSFFANRDVDDIADDPNALPNNTYTMRIIGAKIGPTRDKSKTGITFRYQICEGPWSTFFALTDWVRVPDANTKEDEIERILSYIKNRLLAFGYSVEEIAKFGPKMVEDCVNRTFYGTTSSRKGTDNNVNIRVVKFDPIGDDDGADVDGYDPTDEDI